MKLVLMQRKSNGTELEVQPDLPWNEKVVIAVVVLMDDQKLELVTWIMEVGRAITALYRKSFGVLFDLFTIFIFHWYLANYIRHCCSRSRDGQPGNADGGCGGGRGGSRETIRRLWCVCICDLRRHLPIVNPKL